MKPYPHKCLEKEERIFNYRLSRARRVVENAFGILANRFRLFLTTIALEPEDVDYVVLVACVLHNYLITHQSTHYTPPNFVDHEDETHRTIEGMWRADKNYLVSVNNTRSRNATQSAKSQREGLKRFFNNHGAVSWQNTMIS